MLETEGSWARRRSGRHVSGWPIIAASRAHRRGSAGGPADVDEVARSDAVESRPRGLRVEGGRHVVSEWSSSADGHEIGLPSFAQSAHTPEGSEP